MDDRYLPDTLDGKISRMVEECGEVLQAVGKIGRWGFLAHDTLTGIVYDNREALRKELKDLRDAAERLDSDLANVDTYDPEELAWHQEKARRG